MNVVYRQTKEHGIGTLEIDGVVVENLIWVNIHANTDADAITFPTIEFAYADPETNKVRRDRIRK